MPTAEDKANAERPPSPAARRALAEAAARRGERDRNRADLPKPGSAKEVGGRDGLEPTRYGDWERDGLTSDF